MLIVERRRRMPRRSEQRRKGERRASSQQGFTGGEATFPERNRRNEQRGRSERRVRQRRCTLIGCPRRGKNAASASRPPHDRHFV